jgi:hypothetical protein
MEEILGPMQFGGRTSGNGMQVQESEIPGSVWERMRESGSQIRALFSLKGAPDNRQDERHLEADSNGSAPSHNKVESKIHNSVWGGSKNRALPLECTVL